MFKDGAMKTYSNDEYDKDKLEAMKDDVWQIWTFGPMLLKDGQPMSEFNLQKKIGETNPRTAVGYYEPGHYVFVTVDGRQPGYSDGLDMEDLSKLMYDLGCKEAFNLDGGGTTQMAFMGEEINQPSVHRKAREALCIVDEPATDEPAS
jgi:exopolysaccharide biosynthesis protein